MRDGQVRDLKGLVAEMGATDLEDAERLLTGYVGREQVKIRPLPADPGNKVQFYIEDRIYRGVAYPFGLAELWSEMDAIRDAMARRDTRAAESARKRRLMAYQSTYPVLHGDDGRAWPPTAAIIGPVVPEWVLPQRNPGLDYDEAGVPKPTSEMVLGLLQQHDIAVVVGEAVSTLR